MSVVYPPVALIDIPYLLANPWETELVLQGPFQQDLREGLYKYTKGKFMLMTTTNSGGFRGIATTTKAIKAPADLKGLKIRTVENDIAFADMRNLGASPTPVAYMELYGALQQGVVDGSTNGVMHVVTAKHHDSIKNILNDNRVFVGGFAAMSTTRFKSFKAEQQKILIDAFNRMAVVQFGVQPRKEIDCYEAFAKAGGKVHYPSEAEMEKYREAEKGLRQLYLDKYGEPGKDLLGKFEKRLADTRAYLKSVYASYDIK
jgi:TRAP-type C4-dicarboxylate transport system substrate-binding protein